MKKKNTLASKVDKSWTVLLVDGQGRIRRIRNFRRKLWMLIGFSGGALLLAVVMGVFYGGMLQKQKTLVDEVGHLEDRIIAIQQQNELLKARAVRLEAQAAGPGNAVASAKDAEPEPSKAEQARAPVPPSSQAIASGPPDAPTEPAPATHPSPSKVVVVEGPEEKREPQVDAESLKLAYQTETETVEAQFVIKNTGQGSAGGRAVVVLHTEEGRSQLRFALPSVPLREGRPLGNQGRRFSISRFMTLSLQRRFAEPGTRFVHAVIYAYTLEGRQLLDKHFDVRLDIPEKKVSSEAAADPARPLPTAAPLGLNLPEPEPETPTGVQP
jgi:hypothetical protein